MTREQQLEQAQREVDELRLGALTGLSRDQILSEIVSGGARGVDRTGERWAKTHGFPVKRIVPD